MANSSTVASGDLATATQYNDLRKDVLDTSTGHRHDEADSRKLSTLDTSTGHTHNGTDSRVAAPPYYEDVASSDTTMTNANTFYTALSRSLAAGTWLIIGASGFDYNLCTLRLYDGTNVLANSSMASTGYDHLSVHCVVVLGSTTTVYLQGACTTAGKKMLATPAYNGSSAAKQTRLSCLRIA